MRKDRITRDSLPTRIGKRYKHWTHLRKVMTAPLRNDGQRERHAKQAA